MAQCKELIKALKNECLDVLLHTGEVDYFQRQYKLLQGKLNALEGQLIDSRPSKQSSEDEDIVMKSETSLDSNTGHPECIKGLLITSMGTHMACQTRPLLHCPDDDTLAAPSVQHNDNNVMHLAAACDDLNISHEHEFQAAHNHKSAPRE